MREVDEMIRIAESIRMDGGDPTKVIIEALKELAKTTAEPPPPTPTPHGAEDPAPNCEACKRPVFAGDHDYHRIYVEKSHNTEVWHISCFRRMLLDVEKSTDETWRHMWNDVIEASGAPKSMHGWPELVTYVSRLKLSSDGGGCFYPLSVGRSEKKAASAPVRTRQDSSGGARSFVDALAWRSSEH